MQSASPESPILQKCRPFLDRSAERVAAYLQADRDEPREWLPRTNPDGTPRWTEDEVTELRNLHLPALPTPERPPYDPDLVLYRVGNLESLDDAFSDRLKAILESRSHSLIVNASGTGKTRLLLEILSRSWGFFFTCYTHRVSSPYGSMDMGAVISHLPTSSIDGRMLHRRPILRGKGARSSGEQFRHNRRIAHTHIFRVLLARLLIFDQVCTLGEQLGISEEVLRRRWLYLQLRPSEVLQTEIFGMVSAHLDTFPLEILLVEIQAVVSRRGDRLQFVALDEAQIAMQSLWGDFASSDGKTSAPILREIVHCLAIAFPRQRILVAGTYAELSVVRDAISDVPTVHGTFEHVYSLGCFDTVERTTGYLRHFFGQTFRDDDCAEVHSFLKGRHRFLALFVAHVLVEGFREMDRVMNSLHEFLTGYSRPGTKFVRLPYTLILTDSQLEECQVIRQAREATFRFALLGEETIFSEDTVAIVRLGIGVFCEPKAHVRIFEPLVFYRLVSWLLNTAHGGDIGALIRHKRLFSRLPVRGIDFAAGLASYLWMAFSGSGRELDDTLTFEGPGAPFWSSHRAKLVLPPSFGGTTEAETPSDHALSAARHPDEVFEWLRAGQRPFIIPDSQFGADLLFFLHVENVGTILVTVFTDPFAADRAHRNPTVSPKEPTSFYPDSPDDRQKLLTILRGAPAVPFSLASARTQAHSVRFNVLRVLCFARALKRPKPYNPPVACVDFDSLLKLQHAPELSFSYLDDIVWGPFS